MKALLVNGYPHEGGCTHTALGIVAGELRVRSNFVREEMRLAR